jgi:DNA-binding transcriptional LysR family regulator
MRLGDGDALTAIDVAGPVTANETEASVAAALEGIGLCYCLEWRIEDEIRQGRLE